MVLGALAAEQAVLYLLLCVVPRAARVRHQNGHELPGEDRTRQVSSEGGRASGRIVVAQPERDQDRSRHGENRRPEQLLLRSRRADRYASGVLGGRRAFHYPGDLSELPSDFLDEQEGCTAHSLDRKG